MPFGERVLFSSATGGASVFSASACGNSSSAALSSGLAVLLPALSFGFTSRGLLSGLRAFLSAGFSLFSAAGSRIVMRSLRPSITTMTSGFSLARMFLAAAAQSAGAPLGWYWIRPEIVFTFRITPMAGCSV
jgi:hypothetical protein